MAIILLQSPKTNLGKGNLYQDAVLCNHVNDNHSTLELVSVEAVDITGSLLSLPIDQLVRLVHIPMRCAVPPRVQHLVASCDTWDNPADSWLSLDNTQMPHKRLEFLREKNGNEPAR